MSYTIYRFCLPSVSFKRVILYLKTEPHDSFVEIFHSAKSIKYYFCASHISYHNSDHCDVGAEPAIDYNIRWDIL